MGCSSCLNTSASGVICPCLHDIPLHLKGKMKRTRKEEGLRCLGKRDTARERAREEMHICVCLPACLCATMRVYVYTHACTRACMKRQMEIEGLIFAVAISQRAHTRPVTVQSGESFTDSQIPVFVFQTRTSFICNSSESVPCGFLQQLIQRRSVSPTSNSFSPPPS